MAFRADCWRGTADRVRIRPQDETGLLDLAAVLGRPRARHAGLLLRARSRCWTRSRSCCADWPAGALHLERFTPAAATHRPSGAAFEVELAPAGLTLTVPPGRSILDVVEAAGVPVLSSCTEGTCGTCETGVLAGVPEHRDSVLSPARAGGRRTP